MQHTVMGKMITPDGSVDTLPPKYYFSQKWHAACGSEHNKCQQVNPTVFSHIQQSTAYSLGRNWK